MSWHLLANDVPSTAGSGPGVFYQAPAIPDAGVYSIDGAGDYQIPGDRYIHMVSLVGADANDGRINTATTRLRGFPKVYPLEALALLPTDPNVMDMRRDPLRLQSQEPYRIEIDDAGGGGVEETVFSILCDQKIPYTEPPSDARWVRFTNVNTGIVGFWSGVTPLATTDQLEADMYEVWGMRLLDDANGTALAGRIDFQGQKNRPGCLAEVAVGMRSHQMFRGGLGVWGTFKLYSLPQVEIFDTAAGGATTYQVDLLLRRVG